jgi:hypothetical protein
MKRNMLENLVIQSPEIVFLPGSGWNSSRNEEVESSQQSAPPTQFLGIPFSAPPTYSPETDCPASLTQSLGTHLPDPPTESLKTHHFTAPPTQSLGTHLTTLPQSICLPPFSPPIQELRNHAETQEWTDIL